MPAGKIQLVEYTIIVLAAVFSAFLVLEQISADSQDPAFPAYTGLLAAGRTYPPTGAKYGDLRYTLVGRELHGYFSIAIIQNSPSRFRLSNVLECYPEKYCREGRTFVFKDGTELRILQAIANEEFDRQKAKS